VHFLIYPFKLLWQWVMDFVKRKKQFTYKEWVQKGGLLDKLREKPVPKKFSTGSVDIIFEYDNKEKEVQENLND